VVVKNHSGLGDTLQFTRFAVLLKEAGARTIVECQTNLVELLSTFQGADCTAATYSEHAPADYSIPSQYLPLMMDWDWDFMSNYEPYVRASESLVAEHRRRLGPSSRLRVGLAWQGKPLWRSDPGRYRPIPLAELTPVATLDNVELFSLQYGAGSEQARSAGFSVQPMEVNNFSATAASAETLDLVISVDTSISHLACALGKPCFVLLPFTSDWRWMTDPNFYPLYPTARLFRQSQPGVWTSAVKSLTEAVRQLAIAKAAGAAVTFPPRQAAATLS
jgi:hypothetical protein